MKRQIIALLLLITITKNFAQNSAVIVGKGFEKLNGKILKISKPIGNFPKVDYQKKEDHIKVENGQFIKQIQIESDGFVSIHQPPYNAFDNISFLVEKGDTLYIEKKGDKIEFGGNNSSLNNIYVNGNPFSPTSENNFDLIEMLKKASSSDELIKQIATKKKSLFGFYENLYKSKKISVNALKIIKSDIEAKIVFKVGHYADGAANEEYRAKMKVVFSTDDAYKLEEFYYSKYYKPDGNAPFTNSIISSDNIHMAARNLEKKAVKSGAKVARFWNQFDELFKDCIYYFGSIDFLTSEQYKELFVAYKIFTALNYNCISDKKELIPVYKAFLKKYPNSVFLQPLEESIFDNTAQENPNNAITSNSSPIGNLSVYDPILGLVISGTFAGENQSLEEAISAKYPNQDLFIDFWATYCPPCIKEFTYNKDLHDFLGPKSIKILYVTVDREVSSKRWAKMVSDYNLTGYHFYPSDNYKTQELNKLSDFVPFYLVYNSKTKKLIKIEGFPHEKEVFYKKLDDAVKETNAKESLNSVGDYQPTKKEISKQNNMASNVQTGFYVENPAEIVKGVPNYHQKKYQLPADYKIYINGIKSDRDGYLKLDENKVQKMEINTNQKTIRITM